MQQVGCWTEDHALLRLLRWRLSVVDRTFFRAAAFLLFWVSLGPASSPPIQTTDIMPHDHSNVIIRAMIHYLSDLSWLTSSKSASALLRLSALTRIVREGLRRCFLLPGGGEITREQILRQRNPAVRPESRYQVLRDTGDMHTSLFLLNQQK